jgi:hypothetical protein
MVLVTVNTIVNYDRNVIVIVNYDHKSFIIQAIELRRRKFPQFSLLILQLEKKQNFFCSAEDCLRLNRLIKLWLVVDQFEIKKFWKQRLKNLLKFVCEANCIECQHVILSTDILSTFILLQWLCLLSCSLLSFCQQLFSYIDYAYYHFVYRHLVYNHFAIIIMPTVM